MSLSAEEFAQIVNPGFKPSTRGRANVEDRRAKRVEQRMRVQIILRQTDGKWRIENLQTRNCSSRGLCLLRDAPLKSGTQMVTIFPKADGDISRILTTVVHCRAMAKGVYAIGAEFTCLLDRKAAAAEAIDPAELERIRKAVLSADA